MSRLAEPVPALEEKLTVGGELDKLAANISIARNLAGVHYFTDYWESLILGEKIALAILEEQKLTYPESFRLNARAGTVPRLPIHGGRGRDGRGAGRARLPHLGRGVDDATNPRPQDDSHVDAPRGDRRELHGLHPRHL